MSSILPFQLTEGIVFVVNVVELPKAESEWQYYIGKKYRQFEKHGAKIQIIDALEPFLSATYKTQIGYSELLLSITGTPKVISMTVKDLVDKLTQERYKKIPKGWILKYFRSKFPDVFLAAK